METLQSKRYTVEEFYELPEDERYELINGELYELYGMAEPTRIHQELVMRISGKILNYIDSKDGDCRVYPAPFGVYLSDETDTVVEPDITVVCDRDKLTDKGCTGAPDWIIEIVSPSNPAHDYIDKLELYMRAGVREYWIVDPGSKRVTVYNQEQPFIPCSHSLDDIIKAGIYKDLSIDFKEIMRKIKE